MTEVLVIISQYAALNWRDVRMATDEYISSKWSLEGIAQSRVVRM